MNNEQGHAGVKSAGGAAGRKRRFSGRPQQGSNNGSRPQQTPGGQRRNGRAQQSSGGRTQQQPRQEQRANPRAPEAGIYSAPMDHNYRAGQESSGRTAVLEALPENGKSRSIVIFVDDLFFVAKIQETARKLNIKVEFCKADKETLDEICAREEKPALIIFDLNANSGKPLTAITKLKGKLKKETSIIGFLMHVQGELKLKASEAGCDMVLPRSAFSQNLPQLLRRHASIEEDEEY